MKRKVLIEAYGSRDFFGKKKGKVKKAKGKISPDLLWYKMF